MSEKLSYVDEFDAESEAHDEFTKLQQWMFDRNITSDIYKHLSMLTLDELTRLSVPINVAGSSLYTIGRIKKPELQEHAIKLCKEIVKKQIPLDTRNLLAQELVTLVDQDI